MINIFKKLVAFILISIFLLGGCSDQQSKNEVNVLASQITITEWQPRSVVTGQSFNTQPNGDSALWFIASGVQTSDNYEFWFGDKRIDALFIELNKSGTVTIPKDFLKSPGKFNLFLKAKPDGKKIELGVFEVKSE